MFKKQCAYPNPLCHLGSPIKKDFIAKKMLTIIWAFSQ